MDNILDTLKQFDFDCAKQKFLSLSFEKHPIKLDDHQMAEILKCLDFDSGKLEVLECLIPHYSDTRSPMIMNAFDFDGAKLKAMVIMRNRISHFEGIADKGHHDPVRSPRQRKLQTKLKSNSSKTIFSNINCSGFSVQSGTVINMRVSSCRQDINLPNDHVFSFLDFSTPGQLITTPDSWKCEEIEIRNGKAYCDGKDTNLDLESLGSMDWKDFRKLAKNAIVDQAKITGKDEKVKEDDEGCVICLENSKKCAAIPCGHKMFCIKCSNKLIDGNKPCPICRKPITSFSVIYE